MVKVSQARTLLNAPILDPSQVIFSTDLPDLPDFAPGRALTNTRGAGAAVAGNAAAGGVAPAARGACQGDGAAERAGGTAAKGLQAAGLLPAHQLRLPGRQLRLRRMRAHTRGLALAAHCGELSHAHAIKALLDLASLRRIRPKRISTSAWTTLSSLHSPSSVSVYATLETVDFLYVRNC